MRSQAINVSDRYTHRKASAVSRRMRLFLTSPHLRFECPPSGCLVAEASLEVTDSALKCFNESFVRFMICLLTSGKKCQS